MVTGKERGIAASMSYEAKARGVTRGMRLADIRKRCPDAVILPSDYETYSLLSTRFFAIVRRYTPDNGTFVFELATEEHTPSYSIQKVKTFTPPSQDKAFVWAQLATNVENACIKARKYKLAAQRVVIFLRTQHFRDVGHEVDLSGPTHFPNDILRAVMPIFEDLFDPSAPYRATGVILLKLSEASYGQVDLFGEAIRMQRLSNLYESVDTLREKYGKHAVFLGASFLAHTHAQHDGERGQVPERQRQLLPDETARKRLGIPMFMGEVR